jgi:hypothetical protein
MHAGPAPQLVGHSSECGRDESPVLSGEKQAGEGCAAVGGGEYVAAGGNTLRPTLRRQTGGAGDVAEGACAPVHVVLYVAAHCIEAVEPLHAVLQNALQAPPQLAACRARCAPLDTNAPHLEAAGCGSFYVNATDACAAPCGADACAACMHACALPPGCAVVRQTASAGTHACTVEAVAATGGVPAALARGCHLAEGIRKAAATRGLAVATGVAHTRLLARLLVAAPPAPQSWGLQGRSKLQASSGPSQGGTSHSPPQAGAQSAPGGAIVVLPSVHACAFMAQVPVAAIPALAGAAARAACMALGAETVGALAAVSRERLAEVLGSGRACMVAALASGRDAPGAPPHQDPPRDIAAERSFQGTDRWQSVAQAAQPLARELVAQLVRLCPRPCMWLAATVPRSRSHSRTMHVRSGTSRCARCSTFFRPCSSGHSVHTCSRWLCRERYGCRV